MVASCGDQDFTKVSLNPPAIDYSVWPNNIADVFQSATQRYQWDHLTNDATMSVDCIYAIRDCYMEEDTGGGWYSDAYTPEISKQDYFAF